MANKAGVICQVWSLNVLESPEMKKDRIGGTLPTQTHEAHIVWDGMGWVILWVRCGCVL